MISIIIISLSILLLLAVNRRRGREATEAWLSLVPRMRYQQKPLEITPQDVVREPAVNPLYDQLRGIQQHQFPTPSEWRLSGLQGMATFTTTTATNNVGAWPEYVEPYQRPRPKPQPDPMPHGWGYTRI